MKKGIEVMRQTLEKQQLRAASQNWPSRCYIFSTGTG
jgi:hypothetical protein